MRQNDTNRLWLYCLMPLLLLPWGCKKMDKELKAREEESGIVRIVDISQDAVALGDRSARLSDTVDIVAKIGLPDAAMQVSLGTRELAVISRQTSMDTLKNGYTGKITGIVAVEHIHVRVPADFSIGVSNFSLTVNGLRKPAYSYTIVKPTLLYPGKVGVTGALVTPQESYYVSGLDYPFFYNPFYLHDGPMGQATSSSVIDAAVDKNSGVVYFLDQLSSDSSAKENADRLGTVVLRKLEAGVVTTIGGNGTDPNATNIRNKKLSTVTSMKAGPDGMLYLSLIDKVPPTAEGAMYYEFVYHAQIVRLNPSTGELSTLIGYKLHPDVLGTNQGIIDGRADTAMVYAPAAIEFDKKGNLYFIDGVSQDGIQGQLLRVLGADSIVRTVMGQYNRSSFDYTTSDGLNTTIDFYEIQDGGGHVDGFYAEARIGLLTGLAVAGNGKIYLLEAGGGIFQYNIREYNPDSREVSTIIGLPYTIHTSAATGSFKEIDLNYRVLASLDVDYDGNILYSTTDYGIDGGRIYKMDLGAESVSLIAGGSREFWDDPLKTPVNGTQAYFFSPRRIVFDQTGRLYVADNIGRGGVTIKSITVQR